MKDRYASLLKREGGFVNHPDDRGGPTNKGITLATLKRTYPDATVEDLKDLTDDEAASIYEKEYFDGPGISQLPEEVQDFVFDGAVNHGPSTAIRLLQEATGADPDGHIGPQTIAAAKDADLGKLVDHRRDYYRKIAANNPSQKVFLKGWQNRLDEFAPRRSQSATAPINRETDPENITQAPTIKDLMTQETDRVGAKSVPTKKEYDKSIATLLQGLTAKATKNERPVEITNTENQGVLSNIIKFVTGNAPESGGTSATAAINKPERPLGNPVDVPMSGDELYQEELPALPEGNLPNIPRAPQEAPAPAPAPAPDASQPILTTAAAQQKAALPQTEEEAQGFWDGLRDKLKDPNISQGLLRMGAGLLTGNGTADAIGRGSAGFADGLALKDKNKVGGYERAVGNIKLPDGSIRSGVFSPGVGVGYYEDGKFVPVNETQEVTDSSITMDRISGKEMQKTRDSIYMDIDSDRELDTYLGQFGDIPEGMERLTTEILGKYNTIFGNEYTTEQIALAKQKGNLQGLLGRFKDEVVGGGVMTEPDAQRIVDRLGGDISVLQNPEAAKQLIEEVMRNKRRGIKRRIREYNLQAKDSERFTDIDYEDAFTQGGTYKSKHRKKANPTSMNDVGFVYTDTDDGIKYERISPGVGEQHWKIL